MLAVSRLPIYSRTENPSIELCKNVSLPLSSRINTSPQTLAFFPSPTVHAESIAYKTRATLLKEIEVEVKKRLKKTLNKFAYTVPIEVFVALGLTIYGVESLPWTTDIKTLIAGYVTNLVLALSGKIVDVTKGRISAKRFVAYVDEAIRQDYGKLVPQLDSAIRTDEQLHGIFLSEREVEQLKNTLLPAPLKNFRQIFLSAFIAGSVFSGVGFIPVAINNITAAMGLSVAVATPVNAALALIPRYFVGIFLTSINDKILHMPQARGAHFVNGMSIASFGLVETLQSRVVNKWPLGGKALIGGAVVSGANLLGLVIKKQVMNAYEKVSVQLEGQAIEATQCLAYAFNRIGKSLPYLGSFRSKVRPLPQFVRKTPVIAIHHLFTRTSLNSFEEELQVTHF